LLEQSEFELIRFENQPSKGGVGVPDAIIQSSIRLLLETKTGIIRRSRPPNLMMSNGEDSKNNDDFVELPAMSQQEFEKAKRELNQQPKVQYSPDGQPLMKGSSRYIDDHNIELYIDRLR
jgi:hypothetical protein